ncbi:MAG: hypothetical protein ACRCX2_24145 [Paraclostridium sp.]
MEFFLEDFKKEVEVRVKFKKTIIKVFLIVENNEVKINNHNRLHIAKIIFSLNDFSMVTHTILFTKEESMNDTKELTIADLVFDGKLLDILITCFEINKNRITLKYFNSFLKELKKIKKEIGA